MHGALTSLFFDHRFLSTRSYLRYPWPHLPNFQQRQYLIFTCFSNFGHYGHLLIVLDDILLGIMAYLPWGSHPTPIFLAHEKNTLIREVLTTLLTHKSLRVMFFVAYGIYS